MPLVLLVHIPLYAPGKSISFGCGNPNWGRLLITALAWKGAGLAGEKTYSGHF